MYSTDHKKALIDLFSNNQDKIYSANNLINEFNGKINKATIYRQLLSLEGENIIRKTYNEKTNTYEYQYARDCFNHLHLRCIKCGKIIHLECKEVLEFITHIENEHEFKVDLYQSTLSGYCNKCKGEM